MAQGRFVSYLRVSTDRQGRSGLGLEAQRTAVTGFLNGGQWELVAEVVEVESGARDDRPKLTEAMALCRITGATLLIAKLDRLSRDAHFLLGLQKAGVRFVAADMPEANELTIGIMAVVAQAERKMISKRTKEAMAVARARGTVLGGMRQNSATLHETGVPASVAVRVAKAEKLAADLAPIIRTLQDQGMSLRGVAVELTRRGIETPRPGGVWSGVQVAHILKRAPAPTIAAAPARLDRRSNGEG
jgi:DNA invertase Pin-like site-specific DNA recombinase